MWSTARFIMLWVGNLFLRGLILIGRLLLQGLRIVARYMFRNPLVKFVIFGVLFLLGCYVVGFYKLWKIGVPMNGALQGLGTILLWVVGFAAIALILWAVVKYRHNIHWPQGGQTGSAWKYFWNGVGLVILVVVVLIIAKIGGAFERAEQEAKDKIVFDKEIILDEEGKSETIDTLDYKVSTEYRMCMFGNPNKNTRIQYVDGRDYSFYNNGNIEKGWSPFYFKRGDRGDRIRLVFKKSCP